MAFRDKVNAPVPELVRYLAVFRRLLTAAVDCYKHRDREGLLLVGELANGLHNTPSMLRSYSQDDWYSPAKYDAWLVRYPDKVRAMAASEETVSLCRRVLSPTGSAEEFGLRPDLTDLDLAPDHELGIYLEMLLDACLWMRGMRDFGGNYPAIWSDLDTHWPVEADEVGRVNGLVGHMLLPVPAGLVRWRDFDEERWRRSALDAAEEAPEHKRNAWRYYFIEKRLK